MSYLINILHLYPDILNLYGDKGNIECLKRRLLWRDIEVNVMTATEKESDFDLTDIDIVFLGGGNDRDMLKVSELMFGKKDEIKEYVNNGGVMLACCGGFQLLGKSYKTPEFEIEGLGILDITSEFKENEKRLIGDIILENDEVGKIVGFENHGARTNIGEYQPLGKVLSGYGNDGKSGFEGVVCKNLTGTNLHGPLLPKNPMLCDKILKSALINKYSDFGELASLDDFLENSANQYIIQNMMKSDTK
ncbi:MAG: glutamine amidotransferase [Ruminococcaceae bacterium]|nr:glutamine amidotransferase [Oscillospiraceae bacterium]